MVTCFLASERILSSTHQENEVRLLWQHKCTYTLTCVCMRTHTYMHVCMHTCPCTHACTHIHAHTMHICIHEHVHTHAHMYTLRHTRTHILMHARAHTHALTHARTHTHTHAQVQCRLWFLPLIFLYWASIKSSVLLKDVEVLYIHLCPFHSLLLGANVCPITSFFL